MSLTSLSNATHPLMPTRFLLNRLLTTVKTLLMLTGLSLAFYYCLTTTLDDMTRRDCQLGVAAACKELSR